MSYITARLFVGIPIHKSNFFTTIQKQVCACPNGHRHTTKFCPDCGGKITLVETIQTATPAIVEFIKKHSNRDASEMSEDDIWEYLTNHEGFGIFCTDGRNQHGGDNWALGSLIKQFDSDSLREDYYQLGKAQSEIQLEFEKVEEKAAALGIIGKARIYLQLNQE
jgi:hypothetical protein